MAGTDLIFSAPPAPGQPVNLVFNDGEGVPSTDVQVVIAGSFPKLHGRATIGAPTRVIISGVFNRLQGSVRVFYNSDTQRPVVGAVVDSFQTALNTESALDASMQDALPAGTTTAGVYQDAAPLRAGFVGRWQQGTAVRSATAGRYQRGVDVGNGAAVRYQEGKIARQGLDIRYQDALKTGTSTALRYQQALRHQVAVDARFQEAKAIGAWLISRVQKAVRAGNQTGGRYQDAVRPPPGFWFRPPVPPVGEPCYVPDPNLVFEALWSADTNLVFVCERHGTTPPDPEPGATVVVPVRRIYVVLNSSSLRRVDGDIPLPTFSMAMSLDADSWTWSFNASLPGRALQYVEPEDGVPVTVEAMINGVPYRFVVEKVGRERAFAQDGLSISGRGLSAELAAPYTPTKSFGNVNARTAQQLMADVLTENNVPLDWTIDWQLEDWNVPGGNWQLTGSYMDAITAIAAAAGGYVQPTPASKTLRILPRYPVLPWNWSTVTPDIELPSAAASRESIEWTDKARYTRVFVSGQGPNGRTGIVTRAGTSGGVVAPDVVDSLITDPTAARQRGGSILADTGRIATYQLRTPAGVRDTDNNPLGIVPPGKFLLYNDNGVTRLGITRSVSVDVSTPDIWQTIGIEAHESV